MNEARVGHRQRVLGALVILAFFYMSLGLTGCQTQDGSGLNPTPVMTAESTPTPLLETQDRQADPSKTQSIPGQSDDFQPIWGTYEPPGLDPATPIPPPLTGLDLSDEVLVWVLLGSDTEPPFTGRIQAIHLLFINPRFSKASLVSIPGNLYVYIPGQTMQRLYTAYALGGIETMLDTLAYNFGISPSRFVLAHPGDFQWLVDDLDSIDVTVFYPIAGVCGGIRAGLVEMDGALALCYASYIDDMDEVDRMQRQQQLLRVIFRKFTHESYLAKLPLLYASYQGWIKTDLSLTELMGYIPLSLRLADPDRISYYMIDWDAMTLWELPGYSQAKVFLPDQEAVRALMQQAIDDVMIPAPLTNQVQTLEAQLTQTYLATVQPENTATPTPTPTSTQTPASTTTMQATGETPTPTPSPTLTPPGYPYP
jgi:anionic cell wall polymer biosynthesis LytR-Cps2A-Psr (LCP) family protein